MNLPTTAIGRTGTVTFDGQTITISRSSALAILTAGPGEKRIPLEHISAVRFKAARRGSSGYIQFTMDGTKQPIRLGAALNEAMYGENSLVFWDTQQTEFEAVRDAVREAKLQAVAERFPATT